MNLQQTLRQYTRRLTSGCDIGCDFAMCQTPSPSSRGFPSSVIAGMVMSIIPQLVLSIASFSFYPTLSIYITHESFHLRLLLPLRLFPGTGTYNTLLSTYPYSVPRWPFLCDLLCHWFYFYVLFLILSFFVTPHIHRSILISFTFNLLSWLFVVDNISVPEEQCWHCSVYLPL